MDDLKTWYQSKTIWGGLVALAATSAGLFGVEVGLGDSTALVSALTDAAGAIGAILAIVGRLTAQKAIARPTR